MQTSMPGQAQGFQFAPQQAAGTPAAKVQNFRQIQDLPTLIAMQQRDPSIPLLAHIDEVRKKLEAQQAVQRQLAVQQSQQQGPQSLNDQILASAAQTAGMAPARGMATGGIVALQRGGDPEIERILQKSPRIRTEEENEKLRAAGFALEQRSITPGGWIDRLNRWLESPFIRENITSGASRLSDEELRKRNDAGALNEKIARTFGATPVVPPGSAQPSAAAAAAPYPEPRLAREAAAATAAAAAAAERRQGSGQGSGRGAGSGTPPPAAREQQPATNNLIDQAFAAVTQAYAPPTVPPELLAQRKRVADLQDLYTQQVQQDATQMRGEADKEIARREARANQPFFESAERPALLASYINPKKGQFFGSLAKGIAAIDIEEEKARKELAQYRATEADKVRQLNNTYRQMQIESAKYVAALKENDLKTARESAEKLAALRYKYETDKAELAIKGREAKAKETAANAAMSAVPSRSDAATQAATARLVSALNNDPIMQAYRKRLEGIISAEDQAALLALMKTREKELRLQYAPELEALGTAGRSAGASNARAAADAIISGN